MVTGRRDERPRVALLFWEGHLGIAPSLINGVRMLADEGYQVDVILGPVEREFAAAPLFPPEVRVVESPAPSPRLDALWRRMGAALSAEGAPASRWRRLALRALWPLCDTAKVAADAASYILFALRQARGRRYVSCIGVDVLGMLAASVVAAFARAQTLYWSLELSFTSEFRNPLKRFLKHLEKRCSRAAAFTLVQDPYRAESLIAENGIPAERILLVPNGPMGAPWLRRTAFFHHRLSLPAGTRVALHAGVINPVALSQEVAASATSWPEGWALVFHERRTRSREEAYIHEVERAGEGRVALSLEPVPYDDLDAAMAGGEIGLAFYRYDLGPNFARMAGASGKLAHYLRCGLPVICSALPGLSELVEEYRCGVAVSSLDEIGPAIQRISDDYALYSANAVRCYRERYEFGRYFRRVLEEIGRVPAVRSSRLQPAEADYYERRERA